MIPRHWSTSFVMLMLRPVYRLLQTWSAVESRYLLRLNLLGASVNWRERSSKRGRRFGAPRTWQTPATSSRILSTIYALHAPVTS